MQGVCCDYIASMKQVELLDVQVHVLLDEHKQDAINELLSPNISTLCNTSKFKSLSVIARSFDIVNPLVKLYYVKVAKLYEHLMHCPDYERSGS